MKLSRRAKRMQRHHDRKSDRNASLNMVSLMDIFTILVFSLLLNTISSEVLPSPQNITLPEAASDNMTVLTASSGDQLASWDEEAEHGENAIAAGAAKLPRAVASLMRATAKIMTKTAYRI